MDVRILYILFVIMFKHNIKEKFNKKLNIIQFAIDYISKSGINLILLDYLYPKIKNKFGIYLVIG